MGTNAGEGDGQGEANIVPGETRWVRPVGRGVDFRFLLERYSAAISRASRTRGSEIAGG